MPRDLFADQSSGRRAPARSNWTILGSILAHAGVLAALFVLPILSALDNFVVHANDGLIASIPAVTMPVPPPPPSAAKAAPIDLNPNAAPPAPPVNPVTSELPPMSLGTGPGVPGAITITGSGTGPLSLMPGTGPVILAPPPKPPAPVRPGGDIAPPARTVYVAPVYPTLARTARLEGTVILECTIDESGVVRDVRVLRSIPLLDRAAIDAVTQWRYTPTRLNGVAVPVLLTVTVTFTLR